MRDIYEIIDEIKKRPEMFTGDRTLKSFCLYLSGIEFGLQSCGIDSRLGYDFHVWVREAKLGMDTSTVGYYGSLIEFHGGDEEKAMDHFFQLIDEYRNLNHKTT